MPPLVSIVIPSFNGRRLLESCLASVREHAPAGVEIEVIVADDGSTDDTAAWLAQAHPGVVLVRRATNGGFCKAANAGIAAARGELIQLLNNDVVVSRGWLEAGLAPFIDPRVGAVAPLVLVRSAPERVDSAGDVYFAVGWPAKRGHGRPAEPFMRMPPHRVFGASGSSAFYRAAALRTVGGFDERFGSYYEDIDLAFRLNWAGHRTVFTPDCRVLHAISASYDHREPDLQRRMARNLELVHWSRLPSSVLIATLPLHLAFLLAQAAVKALKRGLRAFVLGKLDAMQLLFRELRARRGENGRLRREGLGEPEFDLPLVPLREALDHFSRPRETSRRTPRVVRPAPHRTPALASRAQRRSP